MATGLLGRKVGMTQIFDPTGQAIPVTVLQAGPCHVLQIRTAARDGYEAVQLGYLDKPRRLASRSARGHVAKLDSKRQKRRAAAGVEATPKPDCEPQSFIREFRIKPEGLQIGQEVKVDIFAEVKAVDVVGITKGRGYTGVMKRHNFAGQRATHGVKKCTAIAAPSAAIRTPATSIKAAKWPVIMGTSAAPFAISRSPESTSKTTCFWCTAPCRGPMAVLSLFAARINCRTDL